MSFTLFKKAVVSDFTSLENNTTPSTAGGEAFLYKHSSNGAVVSGPTCSIETGAAGSRSVKLSVAADGAVTLNSFTLPTAIGSSGQVLKVPSSGSVLEWGDEGGGGASGVTGAGTDQYVPRFNGTGSLENSNIFSKDGASASQRNVGIGTDNPTSLFHVSGNPAKFSDPNARIVLEGTYNGKFIALGSNMGVFELRSSNEGQDWYRCTTNYHKWYINNAQKVGIDSDGDFIIGSTGQPGTNVEGISLRGTTLNNIFSAGSTNTTYYHQLFYNGNGNVGGISTNATSTSYNTTSDYRRKINVEPLTGALERLEQLPVYRFNFVGDEQNAAKVDGFFAHELQENSICPEAVTGVKDGMKTVVVQEGKEPRDYVAPEFWGEGDDVPEGLKIGDLKKAEIQAQEYQEEITEEVEDLQSVDQSKLVPLLTQCIKELKLRIEALEN